MSELSQKQREYYSRTADQYDALRDGEPEHVLAANLLHAIMIHHQFSTLLDVGAGTGRIIHQLKNLNPNLQIVGVEPVEALRQQGHEGGIPENELVDGDGYNLSFEDQSFDVVSSFGVLHHVEYPEKVISEMLRTSKHAVFISDINSFGYGNWIELVIKRAAQVLPLWKALNYIKTGGKMHRYSEEDGIVFPFNIIAAYHQLRKQCRYVHVMATSMHENRVQANPFISATHLALLAIK